MNVLKPDTFWKALVSLADECGNVEAILAPSRAPLRFAELVEDVAQVRARLNRIGIGRGDRVVAALPRGPETAVCFFGVAACATYIPLNPEYTEDEFASYLARIQPKAIIVPVNDGPAIRDAATKLRIRVVDLVALDAAPAGKFELRCSQTGTCARPEWADAEDVALVLLTSGTTAQPKLVPLKQRHLLALAEIGKKHFRLGHQDRHLHTMPMFHGHGLKSGLTVPILAGSGVICPRQFEVSMFFEHMATLRPTWYSASYTIHKAILDRIQDYRRVARDAKLRFIVSGSGQIDLKVLRGLEAAFDAPVIDRYSMSETNVLTSNPLPPRIRKPGSVGMPVLNEIRIVDERGNSLAHNREGEIVTRGPSVFEGYLDDAEANAKAFLNGWFRTGDLGYFDDDGYLTITGRIKELINRGGEKIGQLEIERVIAEHPSVANVCVFGIPHPTLGEEVAAAVVPTEGALLSEKSIIEFASTRLAGFKVPRCVFFTAQFPTGPTGKTDRKALARAYASLPAQTVGETAESGDLQSPVMSDVAKIWQRLLNTEHVRMDQDFFLAGGDSLKVAELFVAIRERFGLQISMRHIFDEGSTVAGLARLIERFQREKGAFSVLPKRLMPIKADGDRTALFGIPGTDGSPGSFIHLGRLLEARQPLYGLESRGLDGELAPIKRMEDIAADHVNTIRRFQPEGPYFLIGACFGGRVAYEMARQLQAAGETVALLAMLDPSPPFTNSRGLPRIPTATKAAAHDWARLPRFFARRLRMYASEIRRLNGPQRVAFLRAKLGLVREIVARRDLFRGDRSEINRVAVYEANRLAGRDYVPVSYGGRAVVALTDGRVPEGTRNYRLDWLDLMPQHSSLRYVPGRDSGDMLMPPNVYALATAVNEWLEEAHTQEGARVEALRPRTSAAVG